jgi:hypothetical protein
MKIYLAGPMRGYPNFNFPAFFAATKRLREQGHTVFNPAERDVKKHGTKIANSPTGNLKTAIKQGFSLRDALAADTKWICQQADAVYLLPGWQKSKGACAERALGKALGHKIVYLKKVA